MLNLWQTNRKLDTNSAFSKRFGERVLPQYFICGASYVLTARRDVLAQAADPSHRAQGAGDCKYRKYVAAELMTGRMTEGWVAQSV
jgi:hypothetical protein